MTHLIELTPLSDFFFGGEATFGQGENRHYYVRSNHWPQQTSILGMLRYELLKSDPGAFDAESGTVLPGGRAESLVGSQGFDGAYVGPYGIIEGISPVFLLNQERKAFFVRSRAFVKGATRTWVKPMPGFKSENLLHSEATGSASATTGYQIMAGEYPYDGKAEWQESLIGQDGSLLALDEVFVRAHKTGNRKEYDGAADDSGFYKQDLWRLQPGWRFAFFAETDQDMPQGFGTARNVQLGAERRQFRLRIAGPSEKFGNIHFDKSAGAFSGFDALYGDDPEAQHEALAQVVLLSDAAAQPALLQASDFAVAETITFRYLRTHLLDPNSVWAAQNEPKSTRHNLLRRGSALFAANGAPIQNELQNASAFRRIGYNYFKTITTR